MLIPCQFAPCSMKVSTETTWRTTLCVAGYLTCKRKQVFVSVRQARYARKVRYVRQVRYATQVKCLRQVRYVRQVKCLRIARYVRKVRYYREVKYSRQVRRTLDLQDK